jgi:predicted nuclease of predicted toxin-antitoxin system
MAQFVVDANLPRLAVWSPPEFVFAEDLEAGDAASWTDTQLWDYALSRQLTIITKDADLSNRLLVVQSAPRIVHIRVGNAACGVP